MTKEAVPGRPAPKGLLCNIPSLMRDYYRQHPDPRQAAQLVSFGTSGHRGTPFQATFNEEHIVAVSQAICDYRKSKGIDGPCFVGKDTHALSEAAFTTCLEVLAANAVELRIHPGQYTPTPAISHAILAYNRQRDASLADGIVITPSHNPPADGGFKYNPPHGGPADVDVTTAIADAANRYLEDGNKAARRIGYSTALAADTTRTFDYITPYVTQLETIINLQAIREAGLRIGADAMGGAGLAFYGRIAEHYQLNMEILNDAADPTFQFMCVDSDGRIRMDCSSPDAMASLIAYKDKYDIAFGNDPDFDRHGIVSPATGLLNPNHYLAVAIRYLFENRQGWSPGAAIGKTLVSSSMIDRVGKKIGRTVVEVPVGFKWFVPGLLSGDLGFGGEESAGASFLRKDGATWTTDKDGIILALLAAEITAVTGKDPGQHYRELEAELGSPLYARVDAHADADARRKLKAIVAEQVNAKTLAGDPITDRLAKAPGNGAPIGGLKVTTENGWFAARPSGTEAKYKIYAESFVDNHHLNAIQDEARIIVDGVLKAKD